MRIRHSLLILAMLVAAACLPAVRLDVLLHPQLRDSLHAADSLLASREQAVPLLCAGRVLARNTRADTLPPTQADSLVLAALAQTGCRWATPASFHWSRHEEFLLSGNVQTVWQAPACAVVADSLRLGLLALYSPDMAVRYAPSPRARYRYDLPAYLDEELAALRTRCDLVLLLSNLPQHVLEPMLKGLPVDGVLCFDYKPSRQTEMNDVPLFAPAEGPCLWRLWSEMEDGRPVLRGERQTP